MTNKSLRDYINLIETAQQGVAEGAPELLKKEMPTLRHAEKLLAQNGVSKDDPDYHHHLGNTIKYLRQFGNIDLINKSDEQGVAEGSLNNIMSAWNSGMADDEIVKQFGQSDYDSLKRKYGSKLIPVPDLYGYIPKEPTDPVIRRHRGLDGLGKQLKSQIAQIKQKGVAEGKK